MKLPDFQSHCYQIVTVTPGKFLNLHKNGDLLALIDA